MNKKLARAGISSVAIHSNRTQRQRQSALDGFKAGKYQVLVATDIAARGIDVDGITHVINYDVPGFPEDYVHRIGRTGRAAKTGDAITFVGGDERKSLRKIEAFIGKKIPIQKIPDFDGRIPAGPTSESAPKAPRSPDKAKQKTKPKRTAAKPKNKTSVSAKSTKKSVGARKKTHVKSTSPSQGRTEGSATHPWRKRKKKRSATKPKRLSKG